MSIPSHHTIAPRVQTALAEVPVSADDRIATAIELWLFDKYFLAPDRPIWVFFSDRTYDQAIGSQTIADICESHLGVSTVHTLRHTFALMMEDLGAQTSSIQERLGYENLAATSGYLTRLRKAYAHQI